MIYSNEARRTQDWHGRSPLSYIEHIQLREYERSFRFGLDDQTKRIIANNEQIAEQNIEILTNTINSGFYELTLSVDAIEGHLKKISDELTDVRDAITTGTQQITSAVYWGFTETLGMLGRISDQLYRLIQLAETPSHTWAYEQFNLARQESRRALFAEAIESVKRAIEGQGGYSGLKTEFRFHFLLGRLHLGDYKNTSQEVVNLAAAETAFIAAARYAKTDFPNEAGNALIWAGRAAFVGRKFDIAIKHTLAGLALDPVHAQGHYQIARLYALSDAGQKSIHHLATAIALNPSMSISAGDEGEFAARQDILVAGLIEGSLRLTKIHTKYRMNYETLLDFVHKLETYETTVDLLMENQIAPINQALVESEAQFLSGTILGIAKSIDCLCKSCDKYMVLGLEYPKFLENYIKDQYEISIDINTEIGLTINQIDKDIVNINDNLLQSLNGVKFFRSFWFLLLLYIVNSIIVFIFVGDDNKKFQEQALAGVIIFYLIAATISFLIEGIMEQKPYEKIKILQIKRQNSEFNKEELSKKIFTIKDRIELLKHRIKTDNSNLLRDATHLLAAEVRYPIALNDDG